MVVKMAVSTIMAKNYSHCPLKKRPVNLVLDDIDEPENLSTKPEDLSIRRRSITKSPIRASPPCSPNTLSPESNPSISPISPESNVTTSPPISPSPSYLHHEIFHPQHPLVLKREVVHHMDHQNVPDLDYSPQSWSQAVPGYGYLPYPYYNDYFFEPRVPSPPQPSPTLPLAPLAIRPGPQGPFYHLDQHSLSPASSRGESPPTSLPEDLSRHNQPTGAPQRHQCLDCGKSYSTFTGLSKHRQFHCQNGDGPKKSFSCKYCEKVYVSLGALKMHIRTHTLPCKCTICGKAFSRPWLLQGHIRTHTGEKPFSCTYCNRAFADRSNLRAHLQTHSDVKKYSCGTCSKTFSRMSLLTKHNEGGCTSGVMSM